MKNSQINITEEPGSAHGHNKESITDKKSFRLAHGILTALLLIILLADCIYSVLAHQPPDDILTQNKQLTDNTWLYVTKYYDYGHKVPLMYRYYLAGQLNGDFITQLSEMKPFLVADVDNAQITGSGNAFDVSLKGHIFSFTNTEKYRKGDKPTVALISLNASPTH